MNMNNRTSLPAKEERETVISVRNITKTFRVYFDKGSSFKERVVNRGRSRYENHQVLKGISFEVKRGEAIGLIGQNGCGKSTTLKMLSRIMYPDSGTIEMKGRVSALIELGAGFHPDMSGRENIYTNAAIFGLSRKEIDQRIDSIIEFSELGSYIDNPIRTYSSGMYMRLAFSVAINVDADILLVDEILAVGDAAFQAKCFRKLQEIKSNGATIVIVSHSLGQIEQICDRSYWIKDGLIEREGAPYDVHPYYMDYMGAKNTVLSGEEQKKEAKPEPAEEQPAEEQPAGQEQAEEEPETEPAENAKRFGSRDLVITSACIRDKDGAVNDRFRTGDPAEIEILYRRRNPEIRTTVAGIGIFRNDGTNCYGTNTNIDRIPPIEVKDSGRVAFRIDRLNLLPGEYLLDVALHKEDGFNYDYWRECFRFVVHSAISEAGVARLDHSWNIDGRTENV